MIHKPTVAIFTIGSEITLGEKNDTNRLWLAKILTDRGYDVRILVSLPDEIEWIAQWLRAVKSSVDRVITSGGIGGTHDDVTRPSIAKACDLPMSYHKQAREQMERLYGSQINESRLSMAFLPDPCELIENPVSKVPGFVTENIYAYPGFPEMLELMIDQHFSIKEGPPLYRYSIRIDGREGDLAELMNSLVNEYPEVSIGSYPSFKQGGVAVRVIFRGVEDRVSLVKDRFLHHLTKQFPHFPYEIEA